MKSKVKMLMILLVISLLLFACKKDNKKDAYNDNDNDNEIIVDDKDGSNLTDDTVDDTVDDVIDDVIDDKEDLGNYDKDFNLTILATEAEYTGNIRIENDKTGYIGDGYLVGLKEDSDTVTFTVNVPGSGHYDLNFITASFDGYKENNIYIDEEHVGIISVEGTEFQDSILGRMYLSTGEHKITITKSWGWIYIDALEVKASDNYNMNIYNITTELVDDLATDSTKRLMRYIDDLYGEYIISGQYCDKGVEGPEFKAIYNATEKTPAMLGLDFIEYSPSRVAHGSSSKAVEYAIEFDKMGGIVTFCWHWNAPDKYLYNSAEAPWWKGFYIEGTNIDLSAIMNGHDEEGYNLLVSDIDAIALELLKLQEADIPILWRPLHEAAGGWFWWGDSGPEAYIKLYQLLFDRLTNYHNIHNLIWVWNGQGQDWYPGDEYVDIIGTDIYPGERVYTPQVGKFDELIEWTGGKYVTALTENGCLFDPDLAFRDNTIWSYFTTWQGEFVSIANGHTLSEKYTEEYMVKKVYEHSKVITLDELPDLKNY